MRVFDKSGLSSISSVEFKKKALCLTCKEKGAVMKYCNLKRHYDTRHASKYNGFEERFPGDKLQVKYSTLQLAVTFVQGNRTSRKQC
jgi:hypothetical protein